MASNGQASDLGANFEGDKNSNGCHTTERRAKDRGVAPAMDRDSGNGNGNGNSNGVKKTVGSCFAFPDPLQDVRQSTKWVADRARHVSIDMNALASSAEYLAMSWKEVLWNWEDIHYQDGGPLTVQYIFVVDVLNFCFWPDDDLTYDHLARGLKKTLINDNHALDADRLAKCDVAMLRRMLHWENKLPQEEERVRLLKEAGQELLRSFDGHALNLVIRSNGSAAALVDLVTRHFAGFRDHAIYKGRQIFLYKRAQIFVGDVWGAFRGKGVGEFNDIDCLTMFADYLVPIVLRDWNILRYSESLAKKIDTCQEITAGSEEEVEIRACTVAAVEHLKTNLEKRLGKPVLSVEIDWCLWQWGSIRHQKLSTPHHTLTIYY